MAMKTTKAMNATKREKAPVVIKSAAGRTDVDLAADLRAAAAVYNGAVGNLKDAGSRFVAALSACERAGLVIAGNVEIGSEYLSATRAMVASVNRPL